MPDCSLAEALDGGKAKFDAIVLPGTDPARCRVPGTDLILNNGHHPNSGHI